MEARTRPSPAISERARKLRWTMTEPERLLWAMLRGSQLKLRFRRQHPIGSYVLDFYCASARLCVEVDGPVHAEPDQRAHDAQRTDGSRRRACVSCEYPLPMSAQGLPQSLRRSCKRPPPPPPPAAPPPRLRRRGGPDCQKQRRGGITDGPSISGFRRPGRARGRGEGSWAAEGSLASARAIAREWLTTAGSRPSGRGGRWRERSCCAVACWTESLVQCRTPCRAGSLGDGRWLVLTGPVRAPETARPRADSNRRLR